MLHKNLLHKIISQEIFFLKKKFFLDNLYATYPIRFPDRNTAKIMLASTTSVERYNYVGQPAALLPEIRGKQHTSIYRMYIFCCVNLVKVSLSVNLARSIAV